MLPLLQDSWNRIQAALALRAGEAAHQAWLSQLRPVMLERGTVHLEADNQMVADRAKTMFGALLADVLSADFGVQLQVEVSARQPDSIELLEVSPSKPIVDESNRTAQLFLQHLLAGRELPSTRLFLYGPPGVGKTYLLRWYIDSLAGRCMVFSAPQLLKAFQAAHEAKRSDGLLEELCSPRPLVIDEVHRLGGKAKLQAMLKQALLRREALSLPTLLGSRWHPHEIRELDAGLASLFLAGFVTALGAPTASARLRYLRALDGSPSRNGRAQIIEMLAQDTRGAYPELRLAWAKSRAAAPPGKYLQLIDPTSVFARLRDRVAERFAVPKEALCGKGQARQVSKARKVLAMLALEHGLTGGEIGRFLGGRTRAAVSYLARSLQDELKESSELRTELEGLL